MFIRRTNAKKFEIKNGSNYRITRIKYLTMSMTNRPNDQNTLPSTYTRAGGRR